MFITKDAEGLAERLREDTPSPLAYNTEQPEDLLAEDALIQELELALDAVEVVPAERVFE